MRLAGPLDVPFRSTSASMTHCYRRPALSIGLLDNQAPSLSGDGTTNHPEAMAVSKTDHLTEMSSDPTKDLMTLGDDEDVASGTFLPDHRASRP
jgi:hypothetical protein